MKEKPVRMCPTCGKQIEQEVFTIQGKVYCEKCKPPEAEDKTVAFDEATLAETSSPGTMPDDDQKTMAMDQDTGEKTEALGATIAEEGKTVAFEKTEPGAEGTSAGGEKTQALSYALNKSVAATRVIKDVLKIAPDVDLEHASKIYHGRRGKEVEGDTTTPIRDLISKSGDETKYIFDKELGRGGMGAVFATVDQDVRRKVAMKVMLPNVSDNPLHIKRFLEEAQVTGQLEHPNIVPVHDIGIDEESKIYFTMKMVQGEDLDSIISKISHGDQEYQKKYTLGMLLQIFMKICDGIGYAHSKGVLHRDLKPENVMIGAFGEVMVMDWGLAKVLGREDVQSGESSPSSLDTAIASQTMEGQVMGTPSYMSPEQALGKISELDERSDIFSLGCILYKTLTHEAPYKGKNAREALDKARKRQMTPPDLKAPDKQIPPEVNAICMKSMERKKEDRYQDVFSFKNDLQLYLDGKSVSAKKDNIFVRTKKWVIRNKIAAMGIAAAFVCLIIGIIFTSLYEQKMRQDKIASLLTSGEESRVAGKFEDAEEIFFAVLGLDQQNQKAREGIARVSGKALALKNKRLARDKVKEAKQLFDNKDFVKAYDAYVSTFALDPESPEAKKGIKVSAVMAEKQKAQEKIKPILAQVKNLTAMEKTIGGNIVSLEKSIRKNKNKLKGYEDFSIKKPLWDEEKTLLQKNVEKLKTEGKIISQYSTVLGYDGSNGEARKALAQIYYDKFQEAEANQNQKDMAYFKELILAFDDGLYKDLLNKPGTLTISATPPADSYFIFRFIEGPDRRMVPSPFDPDAYYTAAKNSNEQDTKLGIASDFKIDQTAFKPIKKLLRFNDFNRKNKIQKLNLPKGSYLIVARKKGYNDTRIPVSIKRGESKVVDNIALLQKTNIPEGFVYVPEGEFSMGGDPFAPYAAERTIKKVPGFLISEHEVSVGDYLEFINYLEARLPGSAEKYLPRKSSTAGFYGKKTGNRYQTDLNLEWPVLGISWNDARAYCKWLTNKNKDKGWKFRLPEDWEWEKAARGADGRFYPWGNYFDFRFCSMANSHKGKRDGPDPVGSFPLDESVFGVMDIAGNVSEWCQSFFDQEKNIRINRGSAWSYVDDSYARSAGKNGHSPADVADFRGFRVVMSLKK